MDSQPPLLQELPYQVDSADLMRQLAPLDFPVFLDSGMNTDRGARYDILTAQPSELFTLQGCQVTRYQNGRSEPVQGDIFSAVRDALNIAPIASTQDSQLRELPFVGGAAGFFGYEAGYPGQHPSAAHRAQARRDYPATPDASIGIYLWAIIVDHQQRRSVLFALPQCDPDTLSRVQQALAEPPSADPAPPFALLEDFRSGMSEQDYRSRFQRLKDYIVAGDCYQANLARRFQARFQGDPLQAYLRLRSRSNSPFSAYVGLPQGAVLSLSPERFLQVRDGQVLTQPIKGTRRRGATASEDDALKQQLVESEKDQAENLMIVDLLRNDLGSLCMTGSVKTEKLFELQSFNSVHHLVSTISGQLPAGLSPLDLLRNCFPGGSITGAPKIRAMQIIDELEPVTRSVYCGAIGYVGFDGQMDTNIAIRTLLCEREDMYCWGGGGIVADSVCKEEYAETWDKVALLIGLLQSHGGRLKS